MSCLQSLSSPTSILTTSSALTPRLTLSAKANLPGKPLGATARNMGKNDLWIAATAHVLGASLLTTDKDFAHLHSVFVDLVEVPQH
jgi:predicted nucleic acid-binding protein